MAWRLPWSYCVLNLCDISGVIVLCAFVYVWGVFYALLHVAWLVIRCGWDVAMGWASFVPRIAIGALLATRCASLSSVNHCVVFFDMSFVVPVLSVG